MTEAILEARKAYIHNEVPVGGLIVDNTTKSILVRGYNKMNNSLNAINHCEISLISKACKKLQSKYLTNTTLFISLEPCMMCAAAISEAHIGKVYFGAYDEKKGGLENLSIAFKQNNFFLPEIYVCIHEQKSSMLLKKFFKNKRR
jgi:tRNA(Arg) A34 adenosine deaminase TadA